MKNHKMTVMIAALTVLAGCNSSPDERLSRLARDTTAEQASQNRAITEMNREAAARQCSR